MPNKTANYNLIKPLPEEFYNIEDHNSNMDTIDEELKKLNDRELTAEDVGAQPENKNLVEYVDGVLQTVGGSIVESEDESVEAVTSVNGKTGDVKITADDLGVIKVANGGTGYDSIEDTVYTTARYRASALYSKDTAPTTNGVINWTYE